MNNPLVSIIKNNDIKKAVEQALNLISLPDLNNKKILLKPNIGRNVGPLSGINTNAAVTEAVFLFLKNKYKAEFYLGDSPIMGVNSRQAFENSGYKELMNHSDIIFLDLDEPPPVELSITNGKIIKKIKVTGYISLFDYIISIPVLKMHMHTGATLSFKNLKGLLYKKEKVKLHQLQADPEITQGEKELDLAIVDLYNILKPDLAVIDASYAMEGMGPSAGDRVKLDTIIASTDFLAADLTALNIIKSDINHVPHLKLIAEKDNRNIKNIDIVPVEMKDYQVDFKLPPKNISIKYKNVNVLDIGSCSACLSTLFLFVKNNIHLINKYFNEYEQLNLAIGTDLEEIPKDTLLIGNCTKNKCEKGNFILGCPPVQSVIRDVLVQFIENKFGLKEIDYIKNNN